MAAGLAAFALAGLALRGDSTGVGLESGTLPQALSIPTMAHTHTGARSFFMALLLLEALGAGLIFVGIIWWTMFSGRSGGELKPPEQPPETGNKPDSNAEKNENK